MSNDLIATVHLSKPGVPAMFHVTASVLRSELGARTSPGWLVLGLERTKGGGDEVGAVVDVVDVLDDMDNDVRKEKIQGRVARPEFKMMQSRRG
jgi:hypothetical protein